MASAAAKRDNTRRGKNANEHCTFRLALASGGGRDKVTVEVQDVEDDITSLQMLVSSV